MKPASDQQQQSDSKEKVAGETWSAYAHFAFASVFFLGTVILIGAYTQSHDIGKNLDFIRLYKYSKAVFSAGDVKNDLVQYMKTYAWLNDNEDQDHCLDMSTFWWPQYNWGAVAANNPTSATCVFTINLKQGPMEGQLQIKDITKGDTAGCVAGTYTPNWIVPASGTVTSTPTVTIAADKSISFQTSVIGYNFLAFNANFLSCQYKRGNLTHFVHDKTGCQYGYASPMCTCVRAFTARFDIWGSRLNWKPKGKMLLGDVLAEGVGRCIELRRSHDQREELDKVYARSSAVLLFAIAFFFNGLLNLLMQYGFFRDNAYLYGGFFVVYFAGVLGAGLADGDKNGAEMETVLALALPAFLVHGTYLALLHGYFKSQQSDCPPPFLHPVTFDICFSALNLFTLTERGVVQLEYLVAEVLKGHAVAAVYIGVIWYHRYGSDREVLKSEFVQQAYILMYSVGLLAATSSVVTPYAVKKCFELHWLLPVGFAYVAFVTAGWSHHLKMSTNLNEGPAGDKSKHVVHNYNAVSGFLVLLLGCAFWGYYLAEHIQVYGVKHFAYPVSGDPQSFAVLREKLIPSSGVAFFPSPLWAS